MTLRPRFVAALGLVMPLSQGFHVLPTAATTTRRRPLLRATDRELLLGILTRAEQTLSRRIRRDTDDPTQKKKGGKEESEAVSDDASGVNAVPLEICDTLRELRPSIQGLDKVVNDNQHDASNNGTSTAEARPATTATAVIPKFDVNRGYGQNPTITSTALAHELWRHVLRPGLDSAVDATAGNGGDSVVLAKLLFRPLMKANTKESSVDQDEDLHENSDNVNAPNYSELVSVDVQQQACDNTRRALASLLSPQELASKVQIVHGSHSPLPLPRNRTSIALVAYNLGYLPSSLSSSSSSKTGQTTRLSTQTDSTLRSMTDAVLHLRVGGLLSVVTYPRSNPDEDWAVRVFLEGLALFSSVTHDWRDFVQTTRRRQGTGDISSDDQKEADKDDKDVETRLLVQAALERVWEFGPPQQTWRVHEHKKLGWTDAPILLTATRIK